MTRLLRVLIVEDSEDDALLLLRELRKGGYEPLHRQVETPEAMKAALAEQPWELVISDYKMPRFDGLAALQLVQESGVDTPFILISGQIGEDLAVDAMKAGAHDYITKGKMARLVPAIERELREAEVRRARKRAEDELDRYRSRLERMVAERTAELRITNARLQQEVYERRLIEKDLRRSEEDFRRMFDQSPIGVSVVAMDYRILRTNRELCRISGYSCEEMTSLTLDRIIHPDDLPATIEHFQRLAADELDHFQLDRRLIRKRGSTIWVRLSVRIIRDTDGVPSYFLPMMEDITDRKRMEEMIRHQAYHDLLTGLPNRTLFMDHLNLALHQAQRNRQRLAVMFLDLDRFKNINDSMGHNAGDRLLKKVASRLRTCVRESDTVARIGGDEFTILLPSIGQSDDASVTARKIIASLKEPYMIDHHALYVTPSIGISMYPDDGEYADTLLKNADIAMYHAKEQGRDNHQFYNPQMNIRTIERMILENRLRQTLERGELVVHYQPQIAVGTRQMTCVEALVRWQHPEKGLLDPLQFIPLAEETGFIVSIDEWVLRTACAQARAWQDAGMTPGCVTVNLSARQFQQPDLAEMVSEVLRGSGLHPRHLEIEITESTVMQQIESALPNLITLQQMGVAFSIDDFGTGYTSLSYLKKLPVRKIKIDKSFIKGLLDDPDYKAIVSAVIALAHSLKLQVVAEGVETEDQLEFLESAGCDAVQGYLFSEALPTSGCKEIMELFS
ncbi:MAG: EAL domain-containing protein [Nitrospirota bacterium]